MLAVDFVICPLGGMSCKWHACTHRVPSRMHMPDLAHTHRVPMHAHMQDPHARTPDLYTLDPYTACFGVSLVVQSDFCTLNLTHSWTIPGPTPPCVRRLLACLLVSLSAFLFILE